MNLKPEISHFLSQRPQGGNSQDTFTSPYHREVEQIMGQSSREAFSLYRHHLCLPFSRGPNGNHWQAYFWGQVTTLRAQAAARARGAVAERQERSAPLIGRRGLHVLPGVCCIARSEQSRQLLQAPYFVIYERT